MKELKKFLIIVIVGALAVFLVESTLNRLWGISMAHFLERVSDFNL